MLLWEFTAKNLLNVLSENDVTIWYNIGNDAKEDSERGHYARKILYRKHHSVLLDSSSFSDKVQTRKIMKTCDFMVEKYKDLDFYVDIDIGKIHDFYSEGSEEGEELRVTKGSKEYLLTDYSQIMKNLPKRFNKIRIYVSPKYDEVRLERDLLDKLRIEAVNVERDAN